MRTIERFWKEALIKLLISRKANEISAMSHVYEPEVEAYYQDLVSKATPGRPIEPLSKLKDEIRRTIRQNKQTEAMEQWIDGLREQAHIVVDHDKIAQIQGS